MTTTSAQQGWTPLLQQWGKDVRLFLFVVASLLVFRLVLIATFREQIVAGGVGNILAVMAMGLRFDLATAAFWTLPTFLLSTSTAFVSSERWAEKFRRGWITLYAVLAPLIFGADLVYFDEYGDQFNQQMFGIVYDDTIAILITIWKSYHPLLFLALVLPLAWALVRVARWAVARPLAGVGRLQGHRSLIGRVAVGVAAFLLLIAAGRGGTLVGEPIRVKHAFVTDDMFLNRAVMNPMSALTYTLESYQAMRGRGGLKAVWPSGDIRAAARAVSGHEPPPGDGIDAMLQRTASGTLARQRPQHVFLILIESHSGWTLMPEYRGLGLSPALAALADEGIYFKHFLPAGSGTAPALNTLVTGLPEVGLNTNYEPATLQGPYASAVAEQFRRLGYRTRFFYGGFLGWQRLDQLVAAQGFDEMYGGGDMSAGAHTNEWGVDDRYLFDFIERTVDDATPSFNFILTTSNHPPYDLDLDGLGFPMKALPAPLKETKAETVRVLGHLWYSDMQAGRFMREMTAKVQAPLFAVTGDHTARLQIHFPGDSVAEQYAVPLILYGPAVLPQAGIRPPTAGAHMDIGPTLIELAAPAGFTYTSFGTSLFAKSSGSHGQGYKYLVGEGAIAATAALQPVYRFPGDTVIEAAATLETANDYYKALRALAWYRIREGNQLPAPRGGKTAAR